MSATVADEALAKRHVPSIARYPLPGGEMTRFNRVSWTLEPDRAALLVHDMQNYWIGRFAAPEPLVANCAALLGAARASGMPVVYSVARREPRMEDRGLAADMWGAGLGGGRNDPSDAQVIADLAPGPDDILIEKRKYSAFFETDLEQQLRDRGVNQLLVTGVYAHHGCLLSAADAYMRDIKAFFVVDATADHSEDMHLAACRLVPNLCGQNVTTTAVLAGLAA